MKYVVLFNVPAWDIEWGYSRRTVFETRHEAVGAKACLERCKPGLAYRMTVFG